MAQIERARVDEAVAALDKVRRRWLRRPGVAAVDVGFPIRDQVLQRDEVAVRVHVQRKRPLDELASDEVFNARGGEPTRIDGVAVDVIEAAYGATATGQGVAGPTDRDVDRRLRRGSPLMGGLSVGNPRISAGTLAAIVWDVRDGSPHILSNWHVLAGSVPASCGQGRPGNARPEPHYHALAGIEPHYHGLAGPEPHYHSASGGAPHLQAAAVGEPIYQPARFDGGTSPDTVARLSRLRLDRHMDAAIARLTGARAYCADILELGPCQEAEEPQLGMRVHKSGRSTGLSEGIIDGLSLSTVITYPHGAHSFDDQVHIVPPEPWPAPGAEPETSAPGDSGALWINKDSGKAVGLHFGGDVVGSQESEHSLANPITKVLEVLEVSLTPTLRSLDGVPPPSHAASDLVGLVQAILDVSVSTDGATENRAPHDRPTVPSRTQLEILRAVIDGELRKSV